LIVALKLTRHYGGPMNTLDIKHQVSGVISEMVLCGVNNTKVPVNLEYRLKNVSSRLEAEIQKVTERLGFLNSLKGTFEEQKNLFYSKDFFKKLQDSKTDADNVVVMVGR
jgi:hypothetical protein